MKVKQAWFYGGDYGNARAVRKFAGLGGQGHMLTPGQAKAFGIDVPKFTVRGRDVVTRVVVLVEPESEPESE